MIAHMYEPFLPDDAAGGAVICEFTRVIQALVAESKLPPLRKSLRIVLSMECYGFHQYFLDLERTRRTLTVFSFDSCCHFPGGNDLPQLHFRQSSIIQPSFLDTYFPALFRRFLPRLTFDLQRGSLSDDTFCSDDYFGVPSIWPHSASRRYHHNAGPMFHDADWDLAADVARIFGALIATLATGDQAQFRAIAEECKALAAQEQETLATVTRFQLELGRLTRREAAAKIRHHAGRLAAELRSINRFCPGTVADADCAPLADFAARQAAAIPDVEGAPELHDAFAEAARVVPIRLVPGIILSLARVPQPERQPIAIDPLLYALLDGKRTLYDAAKIYEFEMENRFTDADLARFLADLRFLAQYGYLRLERK